MSKQIKGNKKHNINQVEKTTIKLILTFCMNKRKCLRPDKTLDYPFIQLCLCLLLNKVLLFYFTFFRNDFSDAFPSAGLGGTLLLTSHG